MVIALSERDADRIAAHLRKELNATKDTMERIKFLREESEELAAVEDIPAEDKEKTAEVWNKCLAELNARIEEIRELLTLLMMGSEE